MNPKLTAPTSPMVLLRRERGQDVQQRIMFEDLSEVELKELIEKREKLTEKIEALEIAAKANK